MFLTYDSYYMWINDASAQFMYEKLSHVYESHMMLSYMKFD